MNTPLIVRRSSLVLTILLLIPLFVTTIARAHVARIDPRVLQLGPKEDASFWILLREQADLSAAASIRDWDARGRFVVERLKDVADRSQRNVRGRLKQRGVEHQSFWIVNAIKAKGNRDAVAEVTADPEVAAILPDQTYEIPEPIPGKEEASVDAVEWGIANTKAPQVWSTYNDRGEGIVVGSIDTGVLFTHPALSRQYRGRADDGSFDHNYSWFDPSNACASPSLAPCDNNGHGTHTMGTMVGDDGDPGANQIGMAPHARWIAAKGCETSTCSTAALLASGQWMLAPTDLSGQNPRPDLRPQIVNNSWGTNAGADVFYRATVQAWSAAGIFSVFSNGNAGPSCNTVGAPASYVEGYGVGAFDSNNAIASFSSRGAAPASVGGQVKPDIAAPGVNIRSAWNSGAYNAISGTSMAAPHVSGAVALLWSAAPSLIGDLPRTISLLDTTAIDVSSTLCGSANPLNNNTWGEGRLDIMAAVTAAPRGPSGTLSGAVTDDSGNPIGGATIRASGAVSRSTISDPSGAYSLIVPAATYTVVVSAFGYGTESVSNVSVPADTVTILNATLSAVPRHAVTGTVRNDAGEPIANATVTVIGTPLAPTTTDAAGAYLLENVPEGDYSLRAEAGRCNTAQTQNLNVDGDETLDFVLAERLDSYGYFCRIVPFGWVEGTTVLDFGVDDADDRALEVALPFSFPFYGQSYDRAWVATNGFLNFLASSTALSNGAIPSSGTPNAAVYPYWDDLRVDRANASVRTALLGTEPNRQFVIEWHNVYFFGGDLSRRLSFEVVLFENGHILTQYDQIVDDGRIAGNSATVGVENASGTVAFQYSLNEAALTDDLAVRYALPPTAVVQGTITDANDGLPVAGATVRALQSGQVVQQTTTNAAGFYRLRPPLGGYTVEASADNYTTASAAITLDEEDEVIAQNLVLGTGRAQVSPTAFELIVPPGEIRNRSFTIRNSGNVPLSWTLSEEPSASWLAATPPGGTIVPGASATADLTLDTAGIAPGVYDAAIIVHSNSGRQPDLPLPVRLIVPAYRVGADVAGSAYTDRDQDGWVPDRAYRAGSWGFVARANSVASTSPIAGTDDDVLYQTARRGQVEYRFDTLPAGTYQIELRFAELQNQKPGQRIFDVIAEDQYLLPAYDIVAAVGPLAADARSFLVRVTDGTLNLRFVTRRGFKEPLINAIRVTHRPDR